jgi:hypothetical protein
MKVALLSLALFGTELTTGISDRVPELSVEALCKARSADDKMMGLPESQSVADCVRDERNARQKLSTVWETTSLSIRMRCQSEVLFSLGTRSYLDLLSCIQIAEDTKSAFPATVPKGRRRTPHSEWLSPKAGVSPIAGQKWGVTQGRVGRSRNPALFGIVEGRRNTLRQSALRYCNL